MEVAFLPVFFITYRPNDSSAHFYIQLPFVCLVEVKVMCIALFFPSVLFLWLVGCYPILSSIVTCCYPIGMILCECLTGLPPRSSLIVRLLFLLLKVVASDDGADWMLICNVLKT